jgi:WXG100 family type VII secretion target
MTGYRVDPDELARGDALLGDAARHAHGAVCELSAAARGLLDGGWEGSAAAAFRAGWAHWLTGISSMIAALEAMAVSLGHAGAGYTQTDGAVRVSLARLGR